MNLSIIIANFQEADHVVQTIRSIRDTSPLENVEIVLVDDSGGFPKTSGIDFSEKNNIRFLADGVRHGHAWCRTLGAQHASGDWFMFTDAHMRFEKFWFERFAAHAAAADARTLFCTPYISSTADRESNGVEPDVFYGARHYFWEHQLPDGRDWDILGILPLGEPEHIIGLSAWTVPAVIGAGYFLKGEWFQRIGGLPCQFGWSIDEWPLSVKTWLAGGQVKLMPNVRVKHILYPTGHGKDGKGKLMSQDQLLFNKLAVAYQVMAPALFQHFSANLPLPPAQRAQAEAMLRRQQKDLDYWRSYLKSVFVHDVDWLCAKFDLNHPEDIGAVIA